jgi:hypothetical protein
MSFSQRSGIAGTEGWIAPEVLLGKYRPVLLIRCFFTPWLRDDFFWIPDLYYTPLM